MAGERSLEDEVDEVVEEESEVDEVVEEESEGILRGWTPTEEAPVAGVVHIDTGRGGTAEVQVGAPFVETVERIAEEVHYGGYFRVFLNGDELIEDPWQDDAHTELNSQYPSSIEPGMRIAICSYDKVG